MKEHGDPKVGVGAWAEGCRAQDLSQRAREAGQKKVLSDVMEAQVRAPSRRVVPHAADGATAGRKWR